VTTTTKTPSLRKLLKQSIIGNKLANDLWAALPKTEDESPVVHSNGQYKNIRLTARRCSRTHHVPDWWTEVQLTGGLVIRCVVLSTVHKPNQRTIHLKPDWTEDQFKRAVNRLADWALNEWWRVLSPKEKSVVPLWTE
jgi:hypothetical protein